MNKYIFELTVFEDDDKFWAKNPTVEDIEETIWQALRTNNFWHDNSKLEFVEYEKENIATCTTHQRGTNRIGKYACDYLVNMDNLAEWSNENTNSVKFEIIINKDKNITKCSTESWQCFNCKTIYAPYITKCECATRNKGGSIPEGTTYRVGETCCVHGFGKE